MTTRVHESAVINAPAAKVWEAIRGLDFKFWSIVASTTAVDDAKETEVGSLVKVAFKDGTVQKLRRVEYSELDRFVSYVVIESEPSVQYMSQVTTLRVRPVTATNASFVEWISDFSADAGTDVIQDSKFKKLDGFKDLSKALGA